MFKQSLLENMVNKADKYMNKSRKQHSSHSPSSTVDSLISVAVLFWDQPRAVAHVAVCTWLGGRAGLVPAETGIARG